MIENPMISVIMSVYNEENYIKEAIDSILAQTEPDFELLIVDDCSTDNTVNIINGIDDERIILFQNEQNCGLTKNLNKALKECKGKYIARMDGDDISKPERFAIQKRFLDEHRDIMLISCNTETFGEEHLISDMCGTPEELKCRMLIRPVLAHPGFMFRKELVDKYGFTYDEHFRSAQDYDFAVRVAKNHKLFVVPEVLLQYRTHKGQVSQTPNLRQFAYADEIRNRLLEELGIVLTDDEISSFHKWVLEENTDCSIFRRNYELIDRIILHNNGKYAAKILSKSLKKQYCCWMLRSNGKRKMLSIFKGNAYMYIMFLEIGIRMLISKYRRRVVINEK